MSSANSENEGEKRGLIPRKGCPFPPEGMDLMEYLDLREKAESYIEMVMYLYDNLAFEEEDPEQAEKYQRESDRNTGLLKSMKWMDVEVAKPIVAEYPELIRRLEEAERGDA